LSLCDKLRIRENLHLDKDEKLYIIYIIDWNDSKFVMVTKRKTKIMEVR